MEIIYFGGGLGLGLLICWIVVGTVRSGSKQREVLLHQSLQQQSEQHLRERATFEELRGTFRSEFEGLAAEVLEKKSKSFSTTNKEQMDAILAPLDKSIKEFKERFESTFTEETKQRAFLGAQIRELVTNTTKVSQEANNLASALKGDNKKMGNWGEMILETILERSGLREGEQYRMQVTMEGGLRPDAVVYLPEKRVVIIDSKVSLVAYDRYCSEEGEKGEKGEDLQSSALTDLILSIKRHIDNLSTKQYDDMKDAADFVMMFIPIEPAYMLVMQKDSGLWEYAYNKRVLLISPTNLIASLKLISDLWRREMQGENAQRIVERAERMYEKFVGVTESLAGLGRSIEGAQLSYEKVVGQFSSGRGNLVNQAEQLRVLGLKSNKRSALGSDTDLLGE